MKCPRNARSAGASAPAWVSLAAVGIAAAVAAQVRAQEPAKDKTPTSIELTGCISLRPTASGEFTIVDVESGNQFRLSGKGVRKYAGQRVAMVGSPPGRGLKFRFGLWPSPNVAAQAGALDPVQEAVSRQPGGSARMADPASLPELHVDRIRGVTGACQ